MNVFIISTCKTLLGKIKSFQVITVRNSRFHKRLSFCPGRGGEVYTPMQTPSGRHPPGQTPPGRHPPRQTPLLGRHPPRQTLPPGRHPPRQTPPLGRRPAPPSETATAADHTHPTGMHSCIGKSTQVAFHRCKPHFSFLISVMVRGLLVKGSVFKKITKIGDSGCARVGSKCMKT